jgi:hypothetical protein
VTTTDRLRPYNWEQLSSEQQAAVDRTVALARPAEDLDPKDCRRLARLLGLGPNAADGDADA